MRVILNNLAKRYSRQWILKDVNFSFASASCTGITGHNGSGKSTLLKMISGYLPYTKGNIQYILQQEDINPSAIYKYTSVSAPYIELDEEFTIQELYNSMLPYCSFDISGIDEVKSAIQIDVHKKRIASFSSGMKQKVALYFAIKQNRPLLLLDEPSSYLDDTNKTWFKDLLRTQLGKKTIIIASNDPFDFEFCDKKFTI